MSDHETGRSPAGRIAGGLFGAVLGALLTWVLFVLWVGVLVNVLETDNRLVGGLGTAVLLFVGAHVGARTA